jgi:hypothetical protein
LGLRVRNCIGFFQSRFKVRDIRGNGPRIESDGGAVSQQDTASDGTVRFELWAEPHQCLGQPVAPRVGVGVRPEQIDEVLTRMVTAGGIHQSRQQSRRFLGRDAPERVSFGTSAQAAEEFKPPSDRGRRHDTVYHKRPFETFQGTRRISHEHSEFGEKRP